MVFKSKLFPHTTLPDYKKFAKETGLDGVHQQASSHPDTPHSRSLILLLLVEEVDGPVHAPHPVEWRKMGKTGKRGSDDECDDDDDS